MNSPFVLVNRSNRTTYGVFMKKAFVLSSFLLTLLFVQVAYPQRDTRLRTKGYVNPQEIVSLDSTMRMDQALLVIGELSKQYAGKIIIDLEKHKNPIGVYIVNEHWRGRSLSTSRSTRTRSGCTS